MSTEETPNKIIDFLKKQEWPVTTEQVAEAIGVTWNTAQLHLLKLTTNGKIKYKKVGRQNQFWLNRNYEKEMKE